MAWLWIYVPGAGPSDGRAIPLPPEGLRLGREADNDVVLEDGGVSRHHARVYARAGTWLVEDLGSANGSWVEAERVLGRRPLRPGEFFRLGATRCVVVEDQGAALPEPWPPASRPRPPARRRRSRALLALLLLAPLLAGLACGATLLAFLALESRDPRLLPSQLASIAKNGWRGRLRPAPRPSTGTPALDVRPHPALRLEAGPGALDRARSFRARRLDDVELDQAYRSLGVLVATGFELDGGMQEDECLPGTLRMTWDLERLGIPPEARDQVQLARRAPDGRLQLLATRHEQGRVVAELRHNGVFLVVFLGFAGWEAITALKDQWEQGTFDAALADTAGPFRLYWPRKLPLADTPERRRVMGILNSRWDLAKRQPPSGSDREVWVRRYYAFAADSEVKRARALMEDPAWKRANYYPPAVVNALDAFERAYGYLHTTRGFRKRGDLIEIHFIDPWTGSPGAFAYTLDGAYTYPYVHVQLALLPASRETAGASPAMDELHTTALHELFHVVQKEYFNWTKYLNWGHFRGGGEFVWFSEATAVELEEEAEAHYLAKGWVRQFKKTFDAGKFMGLYQLPLDAQGKDEEETLHKGYAASRFLLHLRDRYYAANRERFLPAVLEAFGTFRSGPVDALVKVTSQKTETLSADYREFCARQSAAIAASTPPPAKAELTPGAPRRAFKATGPLASPFVELRFKGASEADLRGAKVIVRTHGGDKRGIAHRWAWMRGKATAWAGVPGNALVTEVKASGHHRLSLGALGLQRIESYTAAPWFGAGDVTTALLLLPPKGAPRLKVSADRKSLHVEVPATPLWKLGESREIRLRFHDTLSRRSSPPISLGERRLEADVELAQVLGALLAQPETTGLLDQALRAVSFQDLQDMLAIAELVNAAAGGETRFRVSYCEVVKGDPDQALDPGVVGPESETFSVPADVQPGALDFAVDGTWRGRVLLLHRPVVLRTGATASIEFGGDQLRFKTAGRVQHGGTELQLLEQVGDEARPTGVSVYVYRLPGRKLWLTVPPSVLRPEGAPAEDVPSWWETLWQARAQP